MNRTNLSRAVVVALIGAGLLGAAPAFSHGPGHGGRGVGAESGPMSEADRARVHERMQTGMRQRLDRMGARLEIKASQQDAWSAYRQARESMLGALPQFPAKEADAATLTRFRAEMARRRADHMAVMAEATAKLQAVLEPDQRRVLDEMARRGGGRGHGERGGYGPHRGHAGGDDHPHGHQLGAG